MCFGTPKVPDLQAAPAKSDAEVQAAALLERKRAAAARGGASTILTGGQGDVSTAPISRKVLLGE